jgi:diaminohydroxyphosphoribosylaminopyrimidine deaminase/5-amino-6-(5-phosphoribosylamino)uracil reductase
MTADPIADRRYMHMALRLGRRAIGRASPNPPVGCVLVRDGRVVGRGWHEYARLDHAEVVAVRAAGDAARGATAYLTLEPCCHFGRTPPCTDLLIQSGIARVVVGLADPNPIVAGKGLCQLQEAGIAVDVGVQAGAAAELVEAFACKTTTGLPLVVSKVGMSLDGRIGTRGRADRQITSPRSVAFTQRLRLALDALLVGVGTILADDPELTYRGKAPKRRPLTRVVLDAELRTPVDARIFASVPDSPVLIFSGSNADPARRTMLQERGADVLSPPGGALELEWVLRELAGRDILGVLVEGGSDTHWSFVSAGLVDKFYFMIAPVVIGGRASVPSVGGAGYEVIAGAPRFSIRRTFACGPDLVLETFPSYSRSILSPWRAATPPFVAPLSAGASRPK